jgi:hypothetical protein
MRHRSLGKFIPEDRVDHTLAAIFAVEKLLPIAGYPKWFSWPVSA